MFAASVLKFQKTKFIAGVGVEPTISTRYERGMIFRFTHPQNYKILLDVFIEYSIHPTNRVYHLLTPQPYNI